MTAQSKSVLMRETRQRKKAVGLTAEFRMYCTPEEKSKLDCYAAKMVKKRAFQHA